MPVVIGREYGIRPGVINSYWGISLNGATKAILYGNEHGVAPFYRLSDGETPGLEVTLPVEDLVELPDPLVGAVSLIGLMSQF